MTWTDDAAFEGLGAPGVALWDVSDRMPQGSHSRATKRPKGQVIDRVFVHHSGALGKPGVAGARNSAAYVTQKRDFPGPGYHYWVPFEELRDDDGRLCILRLVPDVTRAWHSGSVANHRGVGVALQGNTTARPLSYSHEECLEALIPWLVTRFALPMPEGLSWHSDAARSGGRSKAACPGVNAEAWLKGYLRGYRTEAA